MALAIASKIRTLSAKTALRLDSLAARLIAAAAVWTVFGLVIGGLVLSNAFRSAVKDNFDASILDDLDGMIAAAEHDPNGGVVLQNRLLNHRFERVYSGLYWQIAPVQKGASGLEISHSLFDKTIAMKVASERDGLSWGYAQGPENQQLRAVARRVEFPITATARPDDSRAYIFTVAGDLAEVDHETADFNGTLVWAFVVLGAGLIVAMRMCGWLRAPGAALSPARGESCAGATGANRNAATLGRL